MGGVSFTIVVTSQLLHDVIVREAELGSIPIGPHSRSGLAFIYEWKSTSRFCPLRSPFYQNCIRLQTHATRRIERGDARSGVLVYSHLYKRFPFLRFLFLYSSWEPTQSCTLKLTSFVYLPRQSREEKNVAISLRSVIHKRYPSGVYISVFVKKFLAPTVVSFFFYFDRIKCLTSKETNTYIHTNRKALRWMFFF